MSPLGKLCDFVRGVSYDGEESRAEAGRDFTPILRAGNIGPTLNIESDLVWVPQSRVSEVQDSVPGSV